LYEELLIGDNVDGTDHPRIMKAHEDFIGYEAYTSALIELEDKLERFEYEAVLVQLKALVHGFNHTSGVVDYLSTPIRNDLKN
jgi:FlaA1/EpsC-like NDP-sugar epimerase